MHQVLRDRFVVGTLAATGGMGAVYRGLDRATGEGVAIKLLKPGSQHDQRLDREAAVLSELSHPSIVRYIAHGRSAGDEPYLVMEWLEGEDLAARLRRAPLSLEECLALACRLCEALAAAHARGVVHRDLKPSNLFLEGGDAQRVKILDFGIARRFGRELTLTAPGAVLGSVGYMSPEQALGADEVDQRSDLFALGCVLFECLAGRAAFGGTSPVAVLAKVLRDEPVRVGRLRPRLDPRLDQLVAALLCKAPEQRPQSAGHVLQVLRSLEGVPRDVPQLSGVYAAGVALGSEQSVVSVVLGASERSHGGDLQTWVDTDPELENVRSVCARIDAEPLIMRGGAVLIVVSGRGAATDHASQAASCALALRAALPAWRLSVASGRAETVGHVPVGAAIDRAAELLLVPRGDGTDIALDALTAALLPPQFRVEQTGTECRLLDTSEDVAPARLLLGVPTPFVGRDKELGILDLTLDECLRESVARAITVSGPPGQGKSRLRHEFAARVRARGDVGVLRAQGAPVGAGTSFGLLRQVLRQGLGLPESAEASRQRAAVHDHCAFLNQPEQDYRLNVEFLCELLGAPVRTPLSAELRAARADPAAMNEWLRRVFCGWFDAECARRPLLIILDDLHWGDLPSVLYLSEALRRAGQRRVLLVGLGRPEVHTLFPALWAGTETLELVLGRLPRGAARRLAASALGEPITSPTVERLVEQADGNPFFLEELIRCAAQGNTGTEAPETVLALVQSRIAHLPDEERWLVRAASVFGETFWTGGLAALLGPEVSAGELGRWLEQLTLRELIVAQSSSRVPGDTQYAFRHGLLREAAYAMLTDDDRVRGHRLAGAWLEQAGEHDALTLSNHFELGGDPARALPHLTAATGLALDAGNLEATLQLVERASACAPTPRQRGALERLRAAALFQTGDLQAAALANRAALGLLPEGSSDWLACAGNSFLNATFLRQRAEAAELLQRILAAPVVLPLRGEYGWCICVVCSGLVVVGQTDLARTILARAAQLTAQPADADESARIGLVLGRTAVELFSGELVDALEQGRASCRASDRLGLATFSGAARYFLVGVYAELGCAGQAERVTDELRAVRAHSNIHIYADRAAVPLANALIDRGRAAEAAALLEPLLDHADLHLATSARARLSYALVEASDPEGAQRHIATVLGSETGYPGANACARASQAGVALAQGNAADALAAAEAGLCLGVGGVWPRDRVRLALCQQQALRALGRDREAQAGRERVRAALLHSAQALADDELRTSFLRQVAPNQRLLEG